ncbi:U3_small nucleolar ribonucleoprotein IMP4 [Hexamita inflata]|uniref:U3 small nucleolar ribonucleoprotein IMP4 n=1 Tax=Hexamita inflata TaxID=28002 RepID=A0AA86Q867_9EUKA|nr:U3 small nucleolar ribonucleoprotein IMP4 [Hexamita inflata]
MQRRNSRLRTEFRSRSLQQGKQIETREQRDSLQKALQGTTVLQEDQKQTAEQLNADAEFDDQNKLEVVDDEYTNAIEPRILITTSRDPSPRLKLFTKEMKYIFPTAERINRGSRSIYDLVNSVRNAGFTDLILLHETRGQPDGMIISHLPHGPTLYLNVSDVLMRQEVNPEATVLEKAPQLIFENLNQKIGKRLQRIMGHLFPKPKDESDRVVSFVNRSDTILFRNYQFTKVGKEVLLKEQGPRFNLTPYKIMVDAVDSKAEEAEWNLSKFTNTAFKKQVL